MVQTCCCCGFCFRGWIESKPKFLQTSKSSPDLPRHIFTRRRRRKRAATCQFSQRLSFRSLFIGTEFDVFSFKVTINVPHPPHPTPHPSTCDTCSSFAVFFCYCARATVRRSIISVSSSSYARVDLRVCDTSTRGYRFVFKPQL